VNATKTFNRICTGLALLCIACGAIAVLLTRSLRVIYDTAALTQNIVFAVLCVLTLSCVVLVVQVHILKRLQYKQPLFTAGFALGCAVLAMPLTHGAVGMLHQQQHQRVTAGAGFVRITGTVAATLPEILQQTIDPTLPLDRVELDNQGGDVGGALRAAAWLKARGVKTAVVTGACASACAYMTLMFPNRFLAENASLGFHDVRSLVAEKKEEAEGRAELISVITENGISETVARSLFSTTELRWPSTPELLADQLITGCWNTATSSPAACKP